MCVNENAGKGALHGWMCYLRESGKGGGYGITRKSIVGIRARRMKESSQVRPWLMGSPAASHIGIPPRSETTSEKPKTFLRRTLAWAPVVPGIPG
jgi:hypothetical protein